MLLILAAQCQCLGFVSLMVVLPATFPAWIVHDVPFKSNSTTPSPTVVAQFNSVNVPKGLAVVAENR